MNINWNSPVIGGNPALMGFSFQMAAADLLAQSFFPIQYRMFKLMTGK